MVKEGEAFFGDYGAIRKSYKLDDYLNDAKNQIYDVIFVDAFSSDAIPTHLLTKEALDLYQTKLTPDGTIIFHISNRHYDIASVITSTASHKWDVYGFATPPDTLQAFQDFALFCAIPSSPFDCESART